MAIVENMLNMINKFNKNQGYNTVPTTVSPFVPLNTTLQTAESTVKDVQDITKSITNNSKYSARVTIPKMAGINTESVDIMNRFKRIPSLDIGPDVLMGGNFKEYVFIVKPELNIFKDSNGTALSDSVKNIPEFVDCFKRNPNLLYQLQGSIKHNRSPFINPLSNQIINTVDIDDLSADEMETTKNQYGFSLSFRTNSFKSSTGPSVSLEFQETATGEIYQLFKLWDVYENYKAKGCIKPPSPIFTETRKAHDKVAIYKFITHCDYSELLFWAKWWGASLNSVSRGAYSEVSDNITHTIQFKCDDVDDTDLNILDDFIDVIKPYSGGLKIVPLYKQGEGVDRSLVTLPTIQYDSQNKAYNLKWMR